MKRLIPSVLFVALVIAGCSSKDQTPSGPNGNGSIDASVYVSIGNSLTAGYQSGGLIETGQIYSYPKLLSTQLGIPAGNFTQPTIPSPGTGSFISLGSMNPVTLLTSAPQLTPPSNPTHAAPYNNLGIPGSVLYDALDTANIDTKSASRANPFFKFVLRDQRTFGASVVAQALNLKPTLITFWLGNNDVLGFATSGGTSPATPTPTAFFDGLYGNALQALRLGAPNASIVVANIPSVATVPFFTTVGPQIAPVLEANRVKLALPALPLYYQKHGVKGPGMDTTSLVRLQNVLITLPGGSYAPLIGQPTGKWYRDLSAKTGYPLAAVIGPGIDTTKPFGIHPQNPWPDALVLDIDEQITASTTIQAYNESILSAVNRFSKTDKPIALVDINKAFTKYASEGYSVAGEKLTADFIKGGLFSFDGVHPSSKGQGVIANLFIDAMNSTFQANIPKVNISSLPGVPVPMGKSSLPNITSWNIGPDVFNHVLHMFQQ